MTLLDIRKATSSTPILTKTEKIEKQKKQKKGETPQVWMPEWSKGADLRSAVFARVGSNPTPDIFFSQVLKWQKKLKQIMGKCK